MGINSNKSRTHLTPKTNLEQHNLLSPVSGVSVYHMYSYDFIGLLNMTLRVYMIYGRTAYDIAIQLSKQTSYIASI